MNKEQSAIWIVRYADDTYERFISTRKQAEQMAEQKKHLHGGSYKIA